MGQKNTFIGYFRACRRPPVIVNVLLGMAAMQVSGCRLPQLREMDSTPVVPADFNGKSSSMSAAQIGVTEFFGDPQLTNLVTYGLAQNQELRIRNEEVEIANNEVLSRRGAYLPFVSIGAWGGAERNSRYLPDGAAEDQLTRPNGKPFPDPLPRTGLGANLRWEVDIWRQMRNSRDAAYQRYLEALEARNYLITRLVAEIAENYYELAALDQRLVYLEQTIELQNQSLDVAKAQKEAARGTELGVQRFLAEVRKNESQRLIVKQRIIEVENKINFLVGRYPQPVERAKWDFISLDANVLQTGIPVQLLDYRRDIRAAEREVEAAGLDVQVAKANFYPKLSISARVGYEAFNPRYLFDPGAFIANTAGELVAPLINKKAIQAEYLNANARQLQAIFAYQRTILNAFTEVVNLTSKVENYRQSVAIQQEQVQSLEQSVSVATNLFQGARVEVEYMDVLFAQRDLLEARIALIETKQQQLSATVSAYQALGGGYFLTSSGQEFSELFFIPAETVYVDSSEMTAPGVDVPTPAPPAGPDGTGPEVQVPPAAVPPSPPTVE